MVDVLAIGGCVRLPRVSREWLCRRSALTGEKAGALCRGLRRLQYLRLELQNLRDRELQDLQPRRVTGLASKDDRSFGVKSDPRFIDPGSLKI